MKKLEIIGFLKSMLKDYENTFSIEPLTIYFLCENNLDFGFCCYLSDYSTDNQIKFVKKELIKDIDLHTIPNVYLGYFDPRTEFWVITPNRVFNIYKSLQDQEIISDMIKKRALQPRIDHLKRTIARLEKELNIKS